MVRCSTGKLYHGYDLSDENILEIAESYKDDNITICGNDLTEKQKKTLNYFSKVYKLDDDSDNIFINDFDIMSTDFDYFEDPNKTNKAVIMESENKRIPIVYKDKNGIYYFKPIKTNDFFKNEKPTMYLKKYENENENLENNVVIAQPNNIKIKDNSQLFYGIIFFVVIISIVILIYFIYKK